MKTYIFFHIVVYLSHFYSMPLKSSLLLIFSYDLLVIYKPTLMYIK